MVGSVVLIASALIAAMTATVGTVAATQQNAESVRETNATNAQINANNNIFNAQQAQIQRDYETEMANTAVQRKVADLKAAGLNPALAVTNGASFTPGAISASAANPVGMRAVDYSPLAQVSQNLGHLVTSAGRIAMLNELTKKDPKTMAQLSNLAGAMNKHMTRAASMDKMSNISEAEIKALIDDFHRSPHKGPSLF